MERHFSSTNIFLLDTNLFKSKTISGLVCFRANESSHKFKLKITSIAEKNHPITKNFKNTRKRAKTGVIDNKNRGVRRGVRGGGGGGLQEREKSGKKSTMGLCRIGFNAN